MPEERLSEERRRQKAKTGEREWEVGWEKMERVEVEIHKEKVK